MQRRHAPPRPVIVFKPLDSERTKLSERIASVIQETVRSGKLKAGDRLPSERQLAQDFKVNRATIREAIHLLWDRGLVERANRSGTRIVNMHHTTVGAAIERYFTVGDCSHTEFHEVRTVLEPKAAAMAAKNAKRRDLDKLKELLTQMKACWASKDDRGLVSADVEFHLALAAASHNPLLLAIFSGLNPVLNKFLFLQISDMRHEESFRLHEEVYEAIVARDPVGAARAMTLAMNTTPLPS